jgi:hypothetical protein
MDYTSEENPIVTVKGLPDQGVTIRDDKRTYRGIPPADSISWVDKDGKSFSIGISKIWVDFGFVKSVDNVCRASDAKRIEKPETKLGTYEVFDSGVTIHISK